VPELPEVETIKNDLQKKVAGLILQDVLITKKAKQIRKPSFRRFKEELISRKIKKAERLGEFIVLHLSSRKFLVIHLRMTGRLLVRKRNTKPDDYLKVAFVLTKNKELRFTDARGFGTIELLNKKELTKLQEKVGPDPLDKSFTAGDLEKRLQRRKRAIKLTLLDQSIVSGVGNIYANEALFAAKVNPRRKASSLSGKNVKLLHESLKKILKKAIKFRGTTAKDEYFVDTEGKKGRFKSYLKVYQRQGEKCPNCKGKIKRINLGGRGTFFCPSCQK